MSVSAILFMRHANDMRAVACLGPTIFSTLSHTRTTFGGKIMEHKIYILTSSTTFVLK